MSTSQPFWDADTQGWSGGAWAGMRERRYRPRTRQAREPHRSRLWEWLASRRDRIGRSRVPARWNQAADGWDTGAQDVGAARPETWARRGTTLAVIATAATVALLADFWTAVLFVVWAHLVRTGVAMVRDKAPLVAGAGAGTGAGTGAGAGSATGAVTGRARPARTGPPTTPGRAFAEGALSVLVPSRAFGDAEPLPMRTFAEPLPLESGPVEVEEAVRDVVARIAAASARADGETG
ncbi:hypothetical protein [Streptomyces sp. NPDC047981]|uniref:hypothetical protein n=1 Tax=Streptomyces sp. NPDC047981 TaxID=3154610 RepID=UPI0034381D24